MVRTRIAPSPTGNDIHIGNLYTALINWTVARKNNGKFVVRIEDTDRTRYVEGAEEKILKSLADYGLVNDEGPNVGGPFAPYRQSERLELYKKYAKQLVENGKAYYSFVTKEQLDQFRKDSDEAGKGVKDGGVTAKRAFRAKLRDPSVASFTVEEGEARAANEKECTIRLLVPENTDITFHDLIRGEITISTDQVDDQVLLKSDGYPTYHLGVVVDDFEMNITHVIRAEEWISSTPKHVLLYDAFGWGRPVFCHGPILRNPDKSKLSKRKNPVWAGWYLEHGFLPEAILNYLALMGWSHPEQKEIFSIEEFIEKFELQDLAAVGPVFDIKKLEWMNGIYIRNLKQEDLQSRLEKFYGTHFPTNLIAKTVPLVQERIKTLSEYKNYVSFFVDAPTEYEVEISEYKEVLPKIAETIKDMSDWSAQTIGDTMMSLTNSLEIKPSKFFQMLRVVITGKKISPPLNESMEILGKNECEKRLLSAINFIS